MPRMGEIIVRDGVKAPTEYWEQAEQPIAFSRIELYTLCPLTLEKPFYDATGGPFTTVPVTHWLVLWDEDGIAGQGPCTINMEQVILPLLLKSGRKTPLEWYTYMYWAIRNRGFASEAAVELGRFDAALHDIMAKRAGLPLHRLLGARRDWVKVYASAFGTNLTKEELKAEAEHFLRQGYTSFKMKTATQFGTQLDEDIRRVAYVRELLGDHPLAIDVNQLWNASEALEFIKRVEHMNIAWYEEPVNSYDMRQLEKLVPDCPVPVAMGESMRSRYQYYQYIQADARHLQPIPSNLSGVRDWLFVRDEAHEFGLALSSGGYSHQTADYIATAREDDMVEYLYPIMNSLYQMLDLKPQEKDGKFFLPSEPGACTRPDILLWEKMGYIASKRIYFPGKEV